MSVVMLLAGAGAVAALCAAVRKALERPSFRPREFWGGRIRLERLYNGGAAFGNRLLKEAWLVPLSCGVLALVALDRRPGRLWRGLILGGGASNLLERLGSGRVLDYLRFPRAPGRLGRTVFNLADLAIFLGALLSLAAGRGPARRL